MEVQFPEVAVVLLEPEAQQLRCHRSDLVEQLGPGTVDDAGYQGINNSGEPLCEWELSESAHDSTSIMTSDSKPNTSTARTHTVRVLSTRGRSSAAVVTTRNSSSSLPVLPR